MKVNFLVIGTQKAGTSALVATLRKHPQICYCEKNEGHFFDIEEHFTTADVPYEKYHQLFDFDPSVHLVAGESSPSYLYWKPAPERVAAYNPSMRLVVLLRNPIDRAFSHWNMMSRRGWDKKSFSEAIRTEQERTRKDLPLQNKPISYVSRGFYSEQLERWFACFPKEQFLILKSSDMKTAHRENFSGICDFLGVDDLPISQEIVHARIYDNPLPDDDRRWLSAIYRQEVRSLEELLGWDCSDWLETFTD